MAREELMIKPRREVAGVVVEELGRVVVAGVVVCEGAAEELELVVPAWGVACDVAEELELVVPAWGVACDVAEELGLVVPARTTALISPP
jgi:hypothetical protein